MQQTATDVAAFVRGIHGVVHVLVACGQHRMMEEVKTGVRMKTMTVKHPTDQEVVCHRDAVHTGVRVTTVVWAAEVVRSAAEDAAHGRSVTVTMVTTMTTVKTTAAMKNNHHSAGHAEEVDDISLATIDHADMHRTTMEPTMKTTKEVGQVVVEFGEGHQEVAEDVAGLVVVAQEAKIQRRRDQMMKLNSWKIT